MSAFIKLNKQDAFVTPYTAHKTWSISTSETGSYGIRIFNALSSSGGIYIDQATSTTDLQYAELVYKNLEHLYYSRFKNNQVTASMYDTYDQTTLNEYGVRQLFATASVVSIPRNVFGHAIKPGSFSITGSASQGYYVSASYVSASYVISTGLYDGFSIYDNGEGVLLDANNSNQKVGDIIYTHGLAIITDTTTAEEILNIDDTVFNFQSSLDIFTHTYQCRSNQSQLNYSQNPSTYSNTPITGSINSNITGSEFQPYVTTVGLYNDANELIAVGKLGQPIPKSKYVDTTFVVNFDI
jgi:hypothetical protein